jgi:hypothetical protein
VFRNVYQYTQTCKMIINVLEEINVIFVIFYKLKTFLSYKRS